MEVTLPNWNLNSIEKTMNKDYAWDKKRIENAIEEYKKFVFLAKHGKKDDYLSPPGDVDEIWHEHILSTKQYQKDVFNYLGHFLHHIPSNMEKKQPFDLKQYGKIYNRYFKGDNYTEMFYKNGKDDDCHQQCDRNCFCSIE